MDHSLSSSKSIPTLSFLFVVPGIVVGDLISICHIKLGDQLRLALIVSRLDGRLSLCVVLRIVSRTGHGTSPSFRYLLAAKWVNLDCAVPDVDTWMTRDGPRQARSQFGVIRLEIWPVLVPCKFISNAADSPLRITG